MSEKSSADLEQALSDVVRGIESKIEESYTYLEKVKQVLGKRSDLRERLLKLRTYVAGIGTRISNLLADVDSNTIDVLVTQDNCVVTNYLDIYYNGIGENPFLKVTYPKGMPAIPEPDLKQRIAGAMDMPDLAFSEQPVLVTDKESITAAVYIGLGIVAIGAVIGLMYMMSHKSYQREWNQLLAPPGISLIPAFFLAIGGGALYENTKSKKVLRQRRAAAKKQIQDTDRILYIESEELQADPNKMLYEAYAGMAKQLEGNGKKKSAIDFWQKAVPFNPEAAHRAIGDNYFGRGKNLKAAAAFRASLMQNPNSATTRNQLGHAYHYLAENLFWREGHYRRLSVDQYRRASEIDPKDVWYHCNQAVEYVALNLFQDAQRCVDAALSLDANHIRSLELKAEVIEKTSKDAGELGKIYDKLESLQPGHAGAAKFIGRGCK